MITRMCVGVLIQVVITVLSIKIRVYLRWFANAGIISVLDVVVNHTDPAIAR